MIFKRAIAKLRAQEWLAIIIELCIVIVGVFIGTLVANWNQERLEKRETQRMLSQLVPELRTQLEFLDGAKEYYATTRRYGDQALAAWDGDHKVNDAEFIIAAYQASQVTGIGINPDSWSLTFGGGQLRNLDDQKVRRNMEIMLTADYSPVEFKAVATRYREQVRQVIPIAIQDDIRRECGDRNVRGKEGVTLVVLPSRCAVKIEPAAAAATAAALRERPDLVGELRWHLAAVATYLANAELLTTPIRELESELSPST